MAPATTSSRSRVIFRSLTTLTLLLSIILTILPLLPDALMPLLTVHTSTYGLAAYEVPGAVTRPFDEILHLAGGHPAEQQEEAQKQAASKAEARGVGSSDMLAEGAVAYASEAVKGGYKPVIEPNKESSAPAGKKREEISKANIPEHALDQDDSAKVKVSEEYNSLRHAGLSANDALSKSTQAFAWLDGQKFGGRYLRIGALNVCSRFAEEKEQCRTVRQFKDENHPRLTTLTSFPIDTPAPMLLVISLAAQFALLVVLLASFVPWHRVTSAWQYRFNLLRSRSSARGRGHNRYGSNTESVMQLMGHRPFYHIDESRGSSGTMTFGAFRWAFVVIWLGAFAFGIAGVGILLALAVDAKARGQIMGDDAELGSGAYLLATLAFVLLLPLIFYLVPFFPNVTTSHKSAPRRDSSGSYLEKRHDSKSIESVGDVPYILPYSHDVQVVPHAQNDDKSDTRKGENSEGGTAEVDEGEWTMIVPALRSVHVKA